MSILRVALIATTALALSACDGPSTPAEGVSSNAGYRVDHLFVVDGCDVYRFQDAGRNHYLTTCPGTVEQSASCGKNCEYTDQLTTVTRPRDVLEARGQ